MPSPLGVGRSDAQKYNSPRRLQFFSGKLRSVIRLTALLGGLSLGLLAPTPSQAQSIRQAVGNYVEQGLQEEKNPKPTPKKSKSKGSKQTVPPKAKRRKPAKSRRPRPTPRPIPTAQSDRDAEDALGKDSSPLPHRVFGKYFLVDLTLGGGYRGWLPAQFPRVPVDHAGYFTWSFDAKAKLFDFLRLHRGYYESNGLAGPRTNEAVVATQVGQVLPKAAWLLGALGVPVSKNWETLVRYETRSFVTRARPSLPVAVAPRSTSPDTDLSALERTNAPLRFESGFETLVLALRYSPENDKANLTSSARASTTPPQYLGVGLTQYSKPYQVSIGGGSLDDVLFDGRFRGIGLAYGLTTARGISRVYGSVDVQGGLGEVTLLDDLTLNELLPDDWLISYVQGTGELGYTWPLTRDKPTVLLTTEGSLGGAGFFYVKTKPASPAEQEGASSSSNRAPSLNWDLLWSARLRLTLAL